MIMYRMVVIALFAVLLMGDAYAEMEPAEITIHISAEHKAIVSALLEAVDEGTSVTGIADFDALSATYGLIGIDRTGRMPSFHGYRFRLMFPPGVDVATVTVAYGNLSYIQSVEHPFDIEDARLRLLAKVAAGTASGVVFTVIAAGAIANDPRAMGGAFLGGAAIGSSVGFPIGVTKVDPYDSFPMTLLAGVISGMAGYSLLIAGQESDVAAFLFVPVTSSLIASELSRKPPQARRVSFALAPTLNGGLSATATLRF